MKNYFLIKGNVKVNENQKDYPNVLFAPEVNKQYVKSLNEYDKKANFEFLDNNCISFNEANNDYHFENGLIYAQNENSMKSTMKAIRNTYSYKAIKGIIRGILLKLCDKSRIDEQNEIKTIDNILFNNTKNNGLINSFLYNEKQNTFININYSNRYVTIIINRIKSDYYRDLYSITLDINGRLINVQFKLSISSINGTAEEVVKYYNSCLPTMLKFLILERVSNNENCIELAKNSYYITDSESLYIRNKIDSGKYSDFLEVNNSELFMYKYIARIIIKELLKELNFKVNDLVPLMLNSNKVNNNKISYNFSSLAKELYENNKIHQRMLETGLYTMELLLNDVVYNIEIIIDSISNFYNGDLNVILMVNSFDSNDINIYKKFTINLNTVKIRNTDYEEFFKEYSKDDIILEFLKYQYLY